MKILRIQTEKYTHRPPNQTVTNCHTFKERKQNTKMIFISSQLPLTELQTMSQEEILNQDWFLFDWQIKNKKYLSDRYLNKMYYRLIRYPIFYKERIYNYLLTDKYYYTSPLYQSLKGYAQIISMKNVKNSHEITDRDKEVIKQEERLFGEEYIRRMFNLFERNNFRKNPICKYVLG